MVLARSVEIYLFRVKQNGRFIFLACVFTERRPPNCAFTYSRLASPANNRRNVLSRRLDTLAYEVIACQHGNRSFEVKSECRGSGLWFRPVHWDSQRLTIQ
jgi:hypothetical protein